MSNLQEFMGYPSGTSRDHPPVRVAIRTKIELKDRRSFTIWPDATEWVACANRSVNDLLTFWKQGVLIAAVRMGAMQQYRTFMGGTVLAGPPDRTYRPPLVYRTRDDVKGSGTIAAYDGMEWVRQPRKRYRKRQADEGARWFFDGKQPLTLLAREIETLHPTG